MARSVVVVIAVSAFSPEHADASSCGSSSDDDSSSSSDWSNDDDDFSSTPSAPSVPWSAKPPITIDIGFATRFLPGTLGTQTGSVTHESESFSYRATDGAATGEQQPLETAFVGQLRVGKPLGAFYLAGELELGGLKGARVRAEMTSSGTLGSPDITPASVMVIGGVGVAGVGGRVTSFLDLGAEVAGGVRAFAYQFESSYLACETTSTVTTAQAVLEARARASLWLTPQVSLSALLGKSAIDAGVVGGISIGFTNHAFAGR
jgi:hypothetical protein